MNFFGLLYINDWLLLFGGLVFALHKYMTWYHDWWSSQGVPGPKISPFGIPSISSLKEGIKGDKRLTDKYGDSVGTFEGSQPALLTQDDDMLREIMVKQFHNFANRRNFEFPEGSHLERGLFSLREEMGWKDSRDVLSPAFSSGKLKRMTKQVNECAQHTVATIGDLPSTGRIYNLKKLMSDLTMNFIATVAFGLDLKDTDSIQEFSAMGRHTNEQFSDVSFRLFMLFAFPKLSKFLQTFLNITIIDMSSFMFFKKVVSDILETRKKGDSSRLDFIQLMANAHNDTVDKETIEEVKRLGEDINTSHKNKRLTREDILGNGVLFFNAGFDTVSTSLSFLFYELAIHQEFQDQVYEEVADLFAAKKELTYDDIQELKFLDCCFSESLRLHPVVPRIDRETKDDTVINGIKLKKGSIINIPIASIHEDPRRWPNPKEFIPGRFTEEEKKDRSPFSWMPFGYGPRHCIGMRLALMEAKLAAAHIIYNFRFEPCSTTQIPFVPSSFGAVTGPGLDINILPRKTL